MIFRIHTTFELLVYGSHGVFTWSEVQTNVQKSCKIFAYFFPHNILHIFVQTDIDFGQKVAFLGYRLLIKKRRKCGEFQMKRHQFGMISG